MRPRGFVCSAVPLPSVARVRVVRAQATPRATSVKSTRLVSLPQVWVGAISVRAAHIKTVRSLLSGQHTVTSRNLRVRFKASILRNTLSTKIRFTHHVRRAVALLRGFGGELKHMTNWFHVSPPRHLAPPTFARTCHSQASAADFIWTARTLQQTGQHAVMDIYIYIYIGSTWRRDVLRAHPKTVHLLSHENGLWAHKNAHLFCATRDRGQVIKSAYQHSRIYTQKLELHLSANPLESCP